MLLWLRITLIMTVLILALQGAALAAETGDGMIEGSLINGTAGGGGVADQEVTLKTCRNNAELASSTARIDAKSYFAFRI